jgi:hypothetical protein
MQIVSLHECVSKMAVFSSQPFAWRFSKHFSNGTSSFLANSHVENTAHWDWSSHSFCATKHLSVSSRSSCHCFCHYLCRWSWTSFRWDHWMNHQHCLKIFRESPKIVNFEWVYQTPFLVFLASLFVLVIAKMGVGRLVNLGGGGGVFENLNWVSKSSEISSLSLSLGSFIIICESIGMCESSGNFNINWPILSEIFFKIKIQLSYINRWTLVEPLISWSPSQRHGAAFRALARGEGTNSPRLFTTEERKGKESIREIKSSSMVAGA